MLNKAFWNWQHYLRLSCTHQRLIQNRDTWKRRKNMKKVHCYWTTCLAGGLTRSGELAYSQWRANTTLCHTIVRRGEWMASKHCSLSRCSSSWRADHSQWRTVTGFCREVRFFTPKIQFSSNSIPNLIGNSTCDGSIIWTSIIYNSMDFLHLLTTNFYMFYDQFQFSNPNPQIHNNNDKLHVKFNFRIT